VEWFSKITGIEDIEARINQELLNIAFHILLCNILDAFTKRKAQLQRVRAFSFSFFPIFAKNRTYEEIDFIDNDRVVHCICSKYRLHTGE
jgi:hypothetical protein